MKKHHLYTKILRTTICSFILMVGLVSNIIAQEVSSESTVDWINSNFSSTLSLDMNKAGLVFPTGKTTAINRINSQLPILIKDKILALNVDSFYQLEDLVLNGTYSFAEINELIDKGDFTPGIFNRSGSLLNIDHNMNLMGISSSMIRHGKPYTPRTPIEQTASRAYSGIIIDARGTLPVQGEFVKEQAVPCFFPKIWDETMELLYERNMTDVSVAIEKGIVSYDYSDDESRYVNRIGQDPLRIKARKIYGMNRTDPVISRNDALKILSIPENIELLKQGKIVILLDKEQLTYTAQPRQKDEDYYVLYRDLNQYMYENKVKDVSVVPTRDGTKISIQNLKFTADSAQLLPSEEKRLDSIAYMLEDVAQSGEFSITVEGHTASVGKPEGELNLSIERAQAIVQAMQKRGINTTNFTFKGYGGTMPVGDNSTTEGRALNRRVEIIVVPKATYIQRDWGKAGSYTR